jgi:hypothetical protein
MSPTCHADSNQLRPPPLPVAQLQAPQATSSSLPPERTWEAPPAPRPRKDAIRNGKLQVIGYRESTDSREILWDAHGQQIGVYELATKITRNRHGKVAGLYVNQLLQLL